MVGVGVGVGLQQLQLLASPEKFQIGGTLHWQDVPIPVIVSPLTQLIVKTNFHFVSHDSGPV